MTTALWMSRSGLVAISATASFIISSFIASEGPATLCLWRAGGVAPASSAVCVRTAGKRPHSVAPVSVASSSSPPATGGLLAITGGGGGSSVVIFGLYFKKKYSKNTLLYYKEYQ